jgi:signal transduction histidine kinase
MGGGAAREQLAGAGQLLLELAGRLAHDLNNVLATVLGKAELATMFDEPQRWKSSVEETHRGGQQARILLADFQRIQGWWQSEREAVPRADVLALVVRLHGRLLGRSGVDLQPDGAGVTDRPGPLALALWALLAEALERVEPAPRSWALTAHEELVRLHHPGVRWTAAEQESWPPRLTDVARLAPVLGLDVVLDGESTVLRRGWSG